MNLFAQRLLLEMYEELQLNPNRVSCNSNLKCTCFSFKLSHSWSSCKENALGFDIGICKLCTHKKIERRKIVGVPFLDSQGRCGL